MLISSVRTLIEQEVMKNLLSAHKRIADHGSVLEIICLTTFVLKLADKRDDVLTYVVTKDNANGGQNPVDYTKGGSYERQ